METLPRPEHPRPDFQREPWINLNGRWRFAFDPRNEGEQLRWHRLAHPALGVVGSTSGTTGTVLTEDPFGSEIVVPFPWESRLSEVNEPTYKGAAWYQRLIEVPADWAVAAGGQPGGGAAGAGGASGAPRAPGEGSPEVGDEAGLPSVEDTAASAGAAGAGVTWRLHPFLCFGAVDWHARVWVDGRFAVEHAGGYTPFAVDLSRYLRPGRAATLTVRVWDVCDADTPTGKQTPRWYTPSSGIWQTVWLEGRPSAYLGGVRITPHLAVGSATFDLTVAATPEGVGQTRRLAVRSPDDSFPEVGETVTLGAEPASVRFEVRIPEARPWSPEDPHLYDCVVTLTSEGGAPAEAGPRPAADEVGTYFGLRAVGTGRWGGKPYEYVLLNGAPVFLRGALDQAFHPDALHAYPSDAAVRADVAAVKALGLNLLRCHIKVNDPRYYYWCDRLGVLVMYDLPSAGVYTPVARVNWEQTFRAAVERDYNHPCIFAWILFNETWGLEEHQTPESWRWVAEMFDLARSLDTSRLIEDNSATLYDHVVTDLNTWHFYIGDYDRARRHVERVVRQTYEGSGFNFVGDLYSYVQGSEAYRQGTQPLLNTEYAGLSARMGDRDISYSFKFLTGELRRHDMLCGYVYTQLADVEWEHNGLLNYDRTPKEFGYGAFVPGMGVADLNGADFVGLDCPPCQTLAPGAPLRATPFLAHWDPRPLQGARLRWQASAVDRFGETRRIDEGTLPLQPRQYGLTHAGPIELTLPDEDALVTVALWLEDGDGEVRARNYVNVDAHAPSPAPSGSTADPVPGRPGIVVTPCTAERTPQGYALRFLPGDFAATSWVTPTIARGGEKLGATGTGWAEYLLRFPEDFKIEALKGLRLRFEAGSRTARNRIGWKDPLHVLSTDFPQTEALKLPSDLAVSVNGVPLGRVRLPDDPADARGVLSIHLNESFETASYGFLFTLEADAALAGRMLRQEISPAGYLTVRFEVPRRPGATPGGLSLYGARMGAYPVAPTLFLDL